MAWFAPLPFLLAQAAQQPAQLDDGLSLGMRLAIALGIVVGSFVLGALLAKALRMPDYAFRLGVVLCSVIASVAVCVLGWPPKLGIDLSGGVQLIYEVDREQQSSGAARETIATLNRNLAKDGGEKIVVRAGERGQVIVPIPKGVRASDVEDRVEKATTGDIQLSGPTRQQDKGSEALAYKLQGSGEQVDMGELVAAISRRINPGGVKEVTVRRYGQEQVEIIIPEVDDREVDQIKKIISTSGLLEFRIVANERDHRREITLAQQAPGREVFDGDQLVARWVKAGPDPRDTAGTTTRETERGTEVLVHIDKFNVDGGYLTRSAAGIDQRGGPCVEFSFDTRGANLFGGLTGANLPEASGGFARRLGIILDGVLLSAPNIQSTISDRGQITGNFTREDVDFLVGVLNAGRLPAALRPAPISQHVISAQLGEETVQSGAKAMIFSTIAILIFMLVYYRFSGIIANVAVVVNLVMTVALMILIKAAFTLPGLAGLVLTVGMAVDANVLIYERMREELAKGTSLRMAIRNGFSRAMSTIIDSNLTTIFTAIVLFAIGTDQIKGFSVTLFLGLVVSLYTAIFVSRIIFDIAEKKRLLKQLKMMQFVGETHIDFIKYRGLAIAVSSIIIAIGLAAGFMRGSDLFDIDFTGGSSVTILLDEDKPKDIAEVRELVKDLPDAAVSSMGTDNRQFMINTSNRDIKEVQQELKDSFKGDLRTYAMSYGELAMVEAPPAKASDPAKPDGAKPDDAKPASEKPAEPALDAPKTNEAKPESAKPAEPPKVEEKKPDAQPEEKKPEAKPAEEKKPEANDGAARRASDQRLIAAAGSAEAQLAADEPRLTGSSTSRSLSADEKPDAKPEEPAKPEPAKSEPAKPEPDKSDPAKTEPPKTEPAKTEPPAKTDDPAKPETPAKAEAPAQPAPTAPAATTPAATAPPVTMLPAAPAAASAYVGGTRVELKFAEPIKLETLEEIVREEVDAAGLRQVRFDVSAVKKDVQPGLPQNDWMFTTTLPPDGARPLLDRLKARLNDSPVFPSASEIGGKVAGDTQQWAAIAMVASWLMIILYVWVRFQSLVFGIASVIALVHDVLVAVGCLALSYYLAPYFGWALVDPFKISLSVMAALLTIIGFSINDTIVIFDRIREVKGKSPDVTPEMVNLSINQTLSRTIITSGTVLITCLILYLIGGPGIHGFAFTMVVGVIAGSYSTVYIAAPIVLWFKPQLRREEARTPATTAQR